MACPGTPGSPDFALYCQSHCGTCQCQGESGACCCSLCEDGLHDPLQVRVTDSLVRRRDQKELFRPPLQAAVSTSKAAMPTLAFRLGQESDLGQANLGQAKEAFCRIMHARSSNATVGFQIPEESPAPADGGCFVPASLTPVSAAGEPLSQRSWTSEGSSEAGHFQAMIPYRTPRRPASVPPLLIPGSKLAALQLASFGGMRSTSSGQSTAVGSRMSSSNSLQVSKPCPPSAAIAGDCCSAGYVEDGRSHAVQFPLDEVAPMLDAEAFRRVKDYLKSQPELSCESYLQEQLQVASNTQKRAGIGGA